MNRVKNSGELPWLLIGGGCFILVVVIIIVVYFTVIKTPEEIASATASSPAPAPIPVNRGRYVKLVGPTKVSGSVLNIAEMKIYAGGNDNIAKNKIVTMSSTLKGYPSTQLVDDIANNFAHTNGTEDPWMEVDLGSEHDITKIVVYNRTDCCSGRTAGSTLQILDKDKNVTWTSEVFKNKDGGITYQNNHDGKPLFVAKPPVTTIFDSE